MLILKFTLKSVVHMCAIPYPKLCAQTFFECVERKPIFSVVSIVCCAPRIMSNFYPAVIRRAFVAGRAGSYSVS